jgi:hypothetical protein
MPGAELFDTAQQYGTFDCDWKKLGFWEPAFIPFGMTKDELIAGHRRMFRKFYLRPAVIGRYLVKMIRQPRIMADILRAGMDVFRYSMSGYVRGKYRQLRSRREH